MSHYRKSHLTAKEWTDISITRISPLYLVELSCAANISHYRKRNGTTVAFESVSTFGIPHYISHYRKRNGTKVATDISITRITPLYLVELSCAANISHYRKKNGTKTAFKSISTFGINPLCRANTERRRRSQRQPIRVIRYG